MIIDEIKTIASELSDMSPKTQLEIVKLCKNICLKMKDYIVDFDEDIKTDIIERLEDVESELTVAEGNIQANANAITALQNAIAGINTTIGELNTALQALDNAKVDKTTYNAGIATLNQAISALSTRVDNKINIASLILNGASGTLTSEELTTIQNNTDVIIKHGDDTLIKCDVDNGYLNFVGRIKSNIISNQYVQITQDIIAINLSTGAWTFTANAIVNTYNKNQLDALLNAKQNELTAGTGISISNNVISVSFAQPHLYMHHIHANNGDYTINAIIFSISNTPFTYTTLCQYLRQYAYTDYEHKYSISAPFDYEDGYATLPGIYTELQNDVLHYNAFVTDGDYSPATIGTVGNDSDLYFNDNVVSLF